MHVIQLQLRSFETSTTGLSPVKQYHPSLKLRLRVKPWKGDLSILFKTDSNDRASFGPQQLGKILLPIYTHLLPSLRTPTVAGFCIVLVSPLKKRG